MFSHNEFGIKHVPQEPHGTPTVTKESVNQASDSDVEQIKEMQTEMLHHLDNQIKAKQELIDLIKKNLDQAKNGSLQ